MANSPARPPEMPTFASCTVSTQALCCGAVEASVFAVAGSATRPGERAHIGIKFGRVLLYIEDRIALNILAEAVQQATDMADAVFGPLEDAFTDAERRARRRFERSGNPTHLQ